MIKSSYGKMPLPTESVEQQQLMEWAERQSGAYPVLARLFHCPNGGHRSKATAGKLKAEGVRAGVPDMWLPARCRGYSGLVFEMKRKGEKPTEKQREWLAFLQEEGYFTGVCYSAEEAITLVCWYLGIPAPHFAAGCRKGGKL